MTQVLDRAKLMNTSGTLSQPAVLERRTIAVSETLQVAQSSRELEEQFYNVLFGEDWAHRRAVTSSFVQSDALLAAPLRSAPSIATLSSSGRRQAHFEDVLTGFVLRLMKLYRMRLSEPDMAELNLSAIRSAVRFLVIGNVGREPRVFALADGGLSMRWDLPTCSITIEFDSDGDNIALIRDAAGRNSGTLEDKFSVITARLRA